MAENLSNKKKFEQKLKEIVDKMLEQSQLLVIATKRHGKTNASMHIIRELMQRKEYLEQKLKLTIFDTVVVWRYAFDIIPFLDFDDVSILPILNGLIVDMGFVDSNDRRNAISEIVMNDFIKMQKLKRKHEGKIPFKNIYVIEEMQNVLGTYAMNGNKGRFWLTVVSECGNFGQVIMGIGQRFADISTKIVDRTRYYLIGGTSGERDLVKIKGIGGKSLSDKVRTLKRGEFIFWDKKERGTVTLIYFPKFKQNGKPYLYDDTSSETGYVKEVFMS